MVKITIFGLIGTGTSSCGVELSRRNNLKFISAGNIFRKLAKAKCIDLENFSEISLKNTFFDKELDLKIKEFAYNNDDFVIDSRLAWYFIRDSIKVKLVTSDVVRFKRVSIRDNINITEAEEKSLFRENTEIKRYFNCYGIVNYTDDSHFDLIINTDKIKIVDVCLIIEKYIAEN